MNKANAVSIIAATALLALSASQAAAQSGSAACDRPALEEAKAEFLRLRAHLQRTPKSVASQALRDASSRYISRAEECYEAEFGASQIGVQKIDDGGAWAPRALRLRHNLFGTKWGAGTSFLPTNQDNLDADGPRIAGGAVTYSFMANGVDLSAESAGTNTAITSLATFDACMLEEISNAFGAWSAVADIEFVPVSDNGAAFDAAGASGDIRIGAHAFDGAGGVLAHGFFPPPNGVTAAGDVHFDIAEPWFCDPTLGAIDFGIVALHEFGHAIGLRHEPDPPGGDIAVMNASYNPALTFGPLGDDILGAGQIYGGSPVGSTFFFGNLGIGTDEPSASLHVTRDDGSSRVLVAELSSTTATRTMFELTNNGATQFRFSNSNSGESWFFASNAIDDLSFSRSGTGGPEFLLRNNGRLSIGPGPLTVFDLMPNGNLVINGTLTELSDRAAKENIQAVRPQDVLGRLLELPISTWNYKSDLPSNRHMGPMAQDFHQAFGLGADERHLATMDTSAVALAAVQALYQRILQQEEAIQDLSKRLAAAEAANAQLISAAHLQQE